MDEDELKPWINDKADRSEDVPNDFIDSVSKTEKELNKEVEKIMNSLETENGFIILNDKNISILNSIDEKLKNAVFSDEYVQSLTKFVGEFKKTADLTNDYFKAFIPDFKTQDFYKDVLRNSQKNALDLLGEDAFTQKLITPLKQTLESSIVNKLTFTETLKNLRVIIEGDGEKDGALLSHVKRVAYDSYSASDRGYTNTVAQDLGLEFYRYSGGEIDTTRCFCDERNGKYFHKKEIEEWGEKRNLGSCGTGNGWAGMNTNTNKATIFIFAGGYNCHHSILPVSEISVPKEVIERNKANGNYNP
jgi:hypothetical protein